MIRHGLRWKGIGVTGVVDIKGGGMNFGDGLQLNAVSVDALCVVRSPRLYCFTVSNSYLHINIELWITHRLRIT